MFDEVKRSDQLIQTLGASNSTPTLAQQQTSIAQAKTLLTRALDIVQHIPGQPLMRVNVGTFVWSHTCDWLRPHSRSLRRPSRS
jgi:hypothetical protein